MTLLLAEWLFLTLPQVSGMPGKAVCDLGAFTGNRSITLKGALPRNLPKRVDFLPLFPHLHCPLQQPDPFSFSSGDNLVPEIKTYK